MHSPRLDVSVRFPRHLVTVALMNFSLVRIVLQNVPDHSIWLYTTMTNVSVVTMILQDPVPRPAVVTRIVTVTALKCAVVKTLIWCTH